MDRDAIRDEKGNPVKKLQDSNEAQQAQRVSELLLKSVKKPSYLKKLKRHSKAKLP